MAAKTQSLITSTEEPSDETPTDYGAMAQVTETLLSSSSGMADVLGAVAACDQLIGSFTSLYKDLRKAYKTMRHAKEDIKLVKTRIKAIRKLWRLFRKTMKDTFSIDEFSVDLDEYREFHRGLNKHADRIIRNVRRILDILHPLLTRGPVPSWTKFQTRWTSFIQKKEELRPIYEEMRLLTGYMNFFIGLVLLQIAAKQYELGRSAATKVQVDTLEGTLKAELKEIKRIQKDQQSNIRLLQDTENTHLLNEVRRVFRQELSKLPRSGPANDSPSDSSSRSSPPLRPPSTPPTNPDDPNNSQGNARVTARELDPISSPPVLPMPSENNRSNSHPVHLFPHSEASYVSIVEEFPPDQANAVPSLSPPVEFEVMKADGSESKSNHGGMYMPTALFGPPKYRDRPRPGRVQNGTLTRTSSRDSPPAKKASDCNQRQPLQDTVPGASDLPSDTDLSSQKHEGAQPDKNSSGPQIASRPTPWRNGITARGKPSSQQTYGADGLVLPSHIIPTPENAEAWLRTQ
ncbi:hypothetical protein BDV06DRAFT_226188 [Aspergillus oleicola]